MQTAVHSSAEPPKSIESARPEPAALPTEKQRVMKKTLRPATTPHGLPRIRLMVAIIVPGAAMPMRTLMSVKKIIRSVETAMTQTRV